MTIQETAYPKEQNTIYSMTSQDRLHQPEKKLFTEASITKQNMADYYQMVAPLMLPHLRDRPLMLECYPDGIDKPPILYETSSATTPDFVHTTALENAKASPEQHYLLCQNERTLFYMTDIGCITPYSWLSRIDKPDMPDKMVIEIEPLAGTLFDSVVKAAFSLKALLEEANMCPHVMLSGMGGVRIICPLRRNRSADRIYIFLRDLTEAAVRQHPRLMTLHAAQQANDKQVLLSVECNKLEETSVVPYAIRALPQAPVAAPVHWFELKRESFQPHSLTIQAMADRIKNEGDVWNHFYRHKRKLMR